MPRLLHRLPKYRRHKPSGQAVVSINGNVVYLGPFKAEWLSNDRRPLPIATDIPVSVVQLVAAFLRHAETYATSNEANTCQHAARPLLNCYEKLPAKEFSPAKLRVVQGEMIRMGWCRTNINKQVARIRSMFKWAVAREMVPPSTLDALRAVSGLKEGRVKDVRESQPVKPVTDELVESVIRSRS